MKELQDKVVPVEWLEADFRCTEGISYRMRSTGTNRLSMHFFFPT